MANKEHVTVKTYSDVADAVAAEILLYENGFSTDDVKRDSAKIQVKAARADEARTLLAAMGSSVTAADTTGVAGSAADAVTGAASTAGDTVQDVASSAVDTVQQAASAVADKVQDATGAVAEKVGQVSGVAADRVESLADAVYEAGVTPGAPSVQATAARTAASTLDRTADYLREGDLSLILEDLRRAIRRNPGRSLLIGLGLGYLARGTLFGASGGTSQAGSRQAQSTQPQAVPVYAGETGVGYDATLSVPPAPMPDTTFDTDFGSTTPPAMGGYEADATLGDTSGISSAASLGAIDTLPDTMLYGTDASTTGTSSGLDELSMGTELGQGSSTGFDDVSLGTDRNQGSSASFDDIGGAGGLGSDTSSLSTGGDLGGSAGLGGDVTSTGEGGNLSTDTSLDDQLRQWDSQTRREEP